MLDLMAVSSIQGGGMPLYLHVVTRILRDLRVQQQQLGTSFDYGAFKTALKHENLTDGQRAPLNQRLETLESFMVKKRAGSYYNSKTTSTGGVIYKGNDWSPVVSSWTRTSFLGSTLTGTFSADNSLLLICPVLV